MGELGKGLGKLNPSIIDLWVKTVHTKKSFVANCRGRVAGWLSELDGFYEYDNKP